MLNKLIGLKEINKQIIIVDDGSYDGTTDIIKNNFIKYHLIIGTLIMINTLKKGKLKFQALKNILLIILKYLMSMK